MSSLFDAINAAAAALSADAEVKAASKREQNGAGSSSAEREQARPQVKSEKGKVKNEANAEEPKAKPRVQPKQSVQPKQRVQPKPAMSGSEKGKVQSEKSAPKAKPDGKASGTAATDSPKTKGGASYVIPKEFKQAIETYLKSRADMKAKLSAKGKTIDGCCDYIFDVMRKRAEKQRGGKSAVGLYAPPEEIFGLAVHYYDESEESLKSEKH